MQILPLEQNLGYLTGATPLEPVLTSGSSTLEPSRLNDQSILLQDPNLLPSTTTPSPGMSPRPMAAQPGGGAYLTPGGDLSSGLLGRVRGETETSRGQVQELGRQFRTQAGPSRDFASIGGTSTLEQALQPGAAPGSVEAAKGLVGAQYQGPVDLDQGALSRIRTTFGGTQAQAEALRSGTGLESTLSLSVPGLTPGQAAFEARRLRYNPEFQAGALRELQNAGRLGGVIEAEDRQARELAQQRAKEEEGIASQSRQFLEGRRGGVLSDIDRDVAAKKAQQENLAELYAQIQAAPFQGIGTPKVGPEIVGPPVIGPTGEKLPPPPREPTDALGLLPDDLERGFMTPGRARSEQAKTDWDAILAKYPTLAEYGPLEKVITKRGREWYGLRQADGSLKDIRKIPGMDQVTERDLVARQRELEGQFGADLGRQENKVRDPNTGKMVAAPAAPQRDILPLYFGEEQSLFGEGAGLSDLYQPPDVRPYLSFDPGVSPARENVSTEDQRAIINTIGDILGEANRLSEAGKPFQAASIVQDVERYLSDEQTALDARGESLSAHEKRWRNSLKKARRQYTEEKNKQEWGRVMSTVGTLGVSDLTGKPIPGASITAGIGAKTL